MLDVLRQCVKTILELIFPPDPIIAKLETLTPAEFTAATTKVQDELPHDIYSIFKYKDTTVRKALWEVKYNGNKAIARLFAALLHEHILEQLTEEYHYNNFSDPLFIPIPLSNQRLHERGWNQSAMIVQELIKLHPHWSAELDVLIKTRHTQAQTRLSREKRLRNLDGCFAVVSKNKYRIENKNIILIDDVTTTGATIHEARRTLLTAGARKVLAFTIAH